MLPGKHSNGQGNVHTFRVNILATRCNATGGTTCEQCQVDWGSLLRRKRRNQRLLICYRVANMAASLFMPEPLSSKQGGGALDKSMRLRKEESVRTTNAGGGMSPGISWLYRTRRICCLPVRPDSIRRRQCSRLWRRCPSSRQR